MLKTVIVGAGISGLLLARLLREKGHPFIILEKSKGVGGRIATRRIDGLGLDHGALYLPPDPHLLYLLKQTGHDHLVQLTSKGLYLSGGMNQFMKRLASDLPLEREAQVHKLNYSLGAWEVSTLDGRKFSTENVVITAPLPQALQLLKVNNLDGDTAPLTGLQYSKALIGLVTTRSAPVIKCSCYRGFELHLMKERGLHPQGLVLEAPPEFAESHFEKTDEELQTLFLELLTHFLQNPEELAHLEVKKWRYAPPLSVYPADYYQPARGLFLIGDSFRIPGPRGAILSAEALSAKIT